MTTGENQSDYNLWEDHGKNEGKGHILLDHLDRDLGMKIDHFEPD